jgi:predicted TIM-barrel fold metal-dependent hydrolase
MTTIDFHTHLGQSIFGYGQTLTELLHSLDTHAIDRAVVCPVQPIDYHLPPENDRVAAAVAAHPDRLMGFGRVDPRRPDAVSELRRCVQDLGLRGLFIHPWEETCPVNHAGVHTLVAEAVALQVPVMLAGGHVRVSMPSQIADLAQVHPQACLIITSGGQINISGIMLSEATQLLREHPHLILETSGIYREDFIEDLVPIIGAERMVFGSNSPEYHQGLEVLRPRLAHLEAAVRTQILGQTAAQILGCSV